MFMPTSLRRESKARRWQSLMSAVKRPHVAAQPAKTEKRWEENPFYQILAQASRVQRSELSMGELLLPQTAHDALGVQALLGNQALQSMFGRRAAAEERAAKTCSCGGTCAQCTEKQEPRNRLLPASTQPSEMEIPEEDTEEAMKGVIARTPPDPATMGGCVICQGGSMQAWIDPSEPACLQPCMRRHEEKHIADFQADPVYKDICKSTPEGECVDYKNMADARRFEHPASDVEIACLASAIPTEKDPGCKSTMQHRKDVTMPEYKKRFASSGC